MGKDCHKILDEIRELHKKYSEVIEGRKNIASEIKKKINELKNITPIYNAELDELERIYKYREDYISDYKLTMDLLLRLLNSKESIYSLKEVTTTGYYNSTGSEVNRLYGKILFITYSSLADKIEDKIYHYGEFKDIISKEINNGYPMIIVTNNIFENSVKPNKNDVKCDMVYDIKSASSIGNITCYANGVDFQESLNKFINYVNINGPDFTNIDEDSLFNLMNNNSKSYQKKIVK